MNSLGLIIYDEDRPFALALCRGLERYFSGRISAFPVTTEAEFRLAFRQSRPQILILQEKLQLSPAIQNEIKELPILTRLKERPERDSLPCIWPGLSLNEITRRIQAGLSGRYHLAQHQLLMIYTAERQLSADYVAKLLHDSRTAAQMVFYLPLMPLSQIRLPLQFSAGPGLASWLMLSRNDLDPGPLGPIFESQSGQFFCPRLDLEHDDLVTAPGDLLRRLVWAYRNLIHEQSHSCLGILDCFALPYPRISALSQLCDVFITREPHSDDFAARSERSELERLRHNLPQSCHFRSLPPPACRRVVVSPKAP